MIFQYHTTLPPLSEVSFNTPQTLTTKSCATKLQEYCQKHQLGDPVYSTIHTLQNTFYSTVTIAGESYTGAVRLEKEEAKECAAEVALKLLCECLVNHKIYTLKIYEFKHGSRDR